MYNISVVKSILFLCVASVIVSVATLFYFNTTPTHAQAALAFSASAPAEQPAQGLLLAALEEPEIDLSEWHTGGTGPFTYAVTVWSTDPLNLDRVNGNVCVNAEVAGSTLTLTPGGSTPLFTGTFRPRCLDEFNVKITEADGTAINRRFHIERNISVVLAVPLKANSNEIFDIAINKGALHTNSIGGGFQGGIGTVTYTAVSSNTACVTVTEAIGTSTISTTEQERRQLGVSVSATNTPEECSATITVTATDDARRLLQQSEPSPSTHLLLDLKRALLLPTKTSQEEQTQSQSIMYLSTLKEEYL